METNVNLTNEEALQPVWEPYLKDEFRQWVMDELHVSARTAKAFVKNFTTGYKALYPRVGVDLYGTVKTFLEFLPPTSRVQASWSVDLYLYELDDGEISLPTAQRRAIEAYHDFIVAYTDAPEETVLKRSEPLADKAEFVTWLERECRMDYENADKVASSVSRMDAVVPSLVSDPMSFLDVLRALPTKSKRENYIFLLQIRSMRIAHQSGVAEKTIDNGLRNVELYANFLNHKL